MWQLASSLTQKLPAETAHNVAVKALSYGLGPKKNTPLLPVTFAGLMARNPLGLAAGFDKNAEAFDGAFHLGFGFVEVGTITPLAQPGNPRPRVFRLPEDEGVINRYGFNGQGMKAAAKRLSQRKPQKGHVLGVNIGANKLSDDKPADYFTTARYLSPYADYITVNISSPNTPGLRDLQDADGMRLTLEATFAGLAEAGQTKPVFVKLAPDLSQTALAQSLEAACQFPLSGIILTNTTISRPSDLRSAHRQEQGGLSGRPVAALSLQSLDWAQTYLSDAGHDMAVISVGGIFDACDVLARILRGAHATQLYSSLSLKGVGLPAQIIGDLDKICHKAGADLDELRASQTNVKNAISEAKALYHSVIS